jgi:hypothetical protein
MKTSIPLRSPGQRSFTMVEILVACTVLVLILSLLSQMMGIVSRAARDGLDRVDNFTKSRATLDLISNDIQRGVFRPDLLNFLGAVTNTITYNGIVYSEGTPAAYPAFYTRMAAIDGSGATPSQSTIDATRDVSLVTYAVVAKTDNRDMYVLQRYSLPVLNTAPTGGSASALQFQQVPNVTSLIEGSTTAVEMTAGVVGFRLSIRRIDGSVNDISTYGGYDTNSVIAIGISLAVVGNKALTELYSMGDAGEGILGTMSSTLQTNTFLTPTHTSYKALWDANTTLIPASPKSLATGFKTFERWVPCTPF